MGKAEERQWCRHARWQSPRGSKINTSM